MTLTRPVGKSGWLEKVFYNGRMTTIADMVNVHGHVCQYDGNSGDGWWVYLNDANGIGVTISPYFSTLDGDRLYHLKTAFKRMYGESVSLNKGRGYW